MKRLLIAMVALLAIAPMSAKKRKALTDKKAGAYLMVYHKDYDHSLHIEV